MVVKILIALAVGFLISLIVTSVMKGKLRSVRKERAAARYLQKDTFRLNRQQDLFLYAETSVTRKQPPKEDN